MDETLTSDQLRSRSHDASDRALASPAKLTLLVGLGSPHGDDQAGWLVASAVQQRLTRDASRFTCRLAKSPCELLDWLDDVTHLIICDACDVRDACESTTQPGELHRWLWPVDRAIRTRSASSHQLSLPDVLDLATTLGRLPAQVEIRTIGASSFSPGTDSSLPVRAACHRLAMRLLEEFAHA